MRLLCFQCFVNMLPGLESGGGPKAVVDEVLHMKSKLTSRSTKRFSQVGSVAQKGNKSHRRNAIDSMPAIFTRYFICGGLLGQSSLPF